MHSITELDRALFKWINSGWSNPSLDLFMRFMSFLADPVTMWMWIIILGFMVYRVYPELSGPGNGGEKRAFSSAGRYVIYCVNLALIYGVNAGIYEIIKVLAARPRPFAVQETILRLPVSGMQYFTSFPSGHAANAFMLAVILSYLSGRMRPAFYCAALATALSRVYLGVHYPGDVAAGACLGASVTWLILRLRPVNSVFICRG